MKRRVRGELELVIFALMAVAFALAMRPTKAPGVAPGVLQRHARGCNACTIAHVASLAEMERR